MRNEKGIKKCRANLLTQQIRPVVEVYVLPLGIAPDIYPSVGGVPKLPTCSPNDVPAVPSGGKAPNSRVSNEMRIEYWTNLSLVSCKNVIHSDRIGR